MLVERSVGQGRFMTMNIPPTAPHEPPLLPLADPSELLAQAHLSLAVMPCDCLLLATAGTVTEPPMITRSPLQDITDPGGAERLAHQLHLMAPGCDQVIEALVVIGDGFQEVLEPLVREILERLGEMLQQAARSLALDREDVLVRGAACGRWWSVDPASSDSAAAVQVAAAGELLPFSRTHTAASAVLAGRCIPRPPLDTARLRALGADLTIPAPDISSRADVGMLFARARTALERLERTPGPDAQGVWMTECEHIAALLSALAVDRLHWELMGRCVERGAARKIDREDLLPILASDGSWRPHADVCAGGSWYRALEELQAVAAGAMTAAPVQERSTARCAWRAVTTLLVLLAWWNHRYASAGELVAALEEVEPHSSLARLLTRLIDTPVRPAWRAAP